MRATTDTADLATLMERAYTQAVAAATRANYAEHALHARLAATGAIHHIPAGAVRTWGTPASLHLWGTLDGFHTIVANVDLPAGGALRGPATYSYTADA